MSSPWPVAAPAFSFSTITGHHDTQPLRVDAAGFHELFVHLKKCTKLIAMTRAEFDALTAEEKRHAKNAPCVIFATFRQGGTRRDEDVEFTTALGLDVDEEHISLASLKNLIAPYEAIIYESLSSTPQHRCWRVIILYAQPLTVQQHEQAFFYWYARIRGTAKSVRNPGRIWYTQTRCKDDGKRIMEYVEGSAFALSVVEVVPRTPQQIFMDRIPTDPAAPAREGERNNQLSRYAASIVRDCATRAVLRGGLDAKNAEYRPPLPDKEVELIAKSTWTKRAKFGWHVADATVVAPEADVGIDIADMQDTDPGEVPWVVQDLLTHGAHLLVGRPKGGKSWVTLDLAYACAMGGSFAGRQVRKTKVLWIAGEDTDASLTRRLQVRGEKLPRGAVKVITGQSLKAERALWDDCSFDQFLLEYLKAHPDVGVVIIDTHKTCEAIWDSEQIDKRRSASAVDIAYQSVRLYEDIGQQAHACILLVHHMGKMKHNKGTDYHERINLPATVVAGVTGSLVLADHPDRNLHDKDDYRRVLAIRGRHMAQGDETLLVELKSGRMGPLGTFIEVQQTRAQQEVFAKIEAILARQDTTTMAEVAAELGKHKNTVFGALDRAAEKPNGLMWKGKLLVIKQGTGLSWAK